MKKTILTMGIIYFVVGVVDLYLDYDKWTILWLSSGIFFTLIGLGIWAIGEIRKISK